MGGGSQTLTDGVGMGSSLRRKTGGIVPQAQRDCAGNFGAGIVFVGSSGETILKEFIMSEDVAAGKAKQIKGKLNDVAGAVKGDTGQQIKGKVEKGVGK